MGERLRGISFQGFRGLPDNSFGFKGRNAAICAGTGVGKSAIVDGIEFAFEEGVARFRGEGTQRISEDEALRHVFSAKPPYVELTFTPSQESLGRELGQAGPLRAENEGLKNYLEDHPSASSFILRRSQILEFICSQEAPRYERFVRLLGLDALSRAQDAFNQAYDSAVERSLRAAVKLRDLRALFSEPELSFTPKSAGEVCRELGRRLNAVGVPGFTEWSKLGEYEKRLQEKRSPQTVKKIDTLNAAITSLRHALPDKVDEVVSQIKTAEERIRKLRDEYPEAARARIVEEGLQYVQVTPDVRVCPLCEQDLAMGREKFLKRLRERYEALHELRRLEGAQKQSLGRLIDACSQALSTLDRDLEHKITLGQDVEDGLQKCRDRMGDWRTKLKDPKVKDALLRIAAPEELEDAVRTRKQLISDLEKKLRELIPKDAEALESASRLLQRAKKHVQALEDAQNTYERIAKLAQLAEDAKDAFTRAREKAIQKVFDRIASKVLDYYNMLHASPDKPECTGVNLTPTSRAAAGGLRFAVQFLGKTHGDPRTYLSDGHLDSLGLCVYLACVRLFNSPGTLLVLDDVLTSIDREHRHRVRDLLLEEFKDYQLIVTTHDEYWFQQIQDAVSARGETKQWVFRRLVNWTPEGGPETARLEATWQFVESNLSEPEYRNLGGPLRCLVEGFLKRVAEALGLKIPYRRDGLHTIHDFITGGIREEIRKALVQNTSQEEEQVKHDLGNVFGGPLMNALSHEGERRLEVRLSETSDFVKGLRNLTKRCEAAGIIKGVPQ